jgi:NADPH:quinone reductase-like Zn-dependent oxidoreductase
VKALVKAKAEPGLWLMDVPEPVPGPGEVLIKVLRTGICGTDLHIRTWDAWARQAVQPRCVLGHEFVGEVVEVGPGVRTSRSATWSAARATGLRQVPQLPGRPTSSVPQHHRSRHRPRRRLRRIRDPARE